MCWNPLLTSGKLHFLKRRQKFLKRCQTIRKYAYWVLLFTEDRECLSGNCVFDEMLDTLSVLSFTENLWAALLENAIWQLATFLSNWSHFIHNDFFLLLGASVTTDFRTDGDNNLWGPALLKFTLAYVQEGKGIRWEEGSWVYQEIEKFGGSKRLGSKAITGIQRRQRATLGRSRVRL